MAKIAIIETGGKQYVVEKDGVLDVELMGEQSAGDKITFDKVVMTDDGKETTLGKPYIDGAKVTAEFVGTTKGEKLTVIRYRQKSRYFKKKGHRQTRAKVKITQLP